MKKRLNKCISISLIPALVTLCWLLLFTNKRLSHCKLSSSSSSSISAVGINCTRISDNGVCFLGRLFCSPGYTGSQCDRRQVPANPWYTTHCPNLEQNVTYRVDMDMSLVSNGSGCAADPNNKTLQKISKCAYLCFSQAEYGVARIPHSMWTIFQSNEASFWKFSKSKSDRGLEHLKGFANYTSLPDSLGNFIEVGCGPFTQSQFLVGRPKSFESITLLDPGADAYVKNVISCSYKTGYLLDKKVTVLSFGAEQLVGAEYANRYDSLMSINVIEHVWDAYAFLANIYNALKPGGLLIFHERFFPSPQYGDLVLGGGDQYHPIRLTRRVLEHFLSKFDAIYLFEGQTTEQRRRACGEMGYYYIGTKKTTASIADTLPSVGN